jgi:glutamate--cysteine ligase
LSGDELIEPFVRAEKPADRWAIGVEMEKFGVDVETGEPLRYSGPCSVLTLFDKLVSEAGWRPEREEEGGPVIALSGKGSITLEPGAQLELSADPVTDVHQVAGQLAMHQAELKRASASCPLAWLAVGFHPLARLDQLPWVPKRRYSIMRSYLPGRGSGALDMMQRTATVQANFDYASEEDALRKLRVLLRLSPLFNVLTANSPFVEGRVSDKKSARAEVWRHMDPSRSGLIAPLWTERRLGYRDYVEWALDAGMFLFKRGGQVIENTGQTFRSFLSDGFDGHRATMADWKLHLQTLFPEVRLKSTLEVRPCDSVPLDLAAATVALFTGITYDARAFDEAEALTEELTHERAMAARPGLAARGMSAPYGERSARDLAERLLAIARGGLSRRERLDASGRDEAIHLEPLEKLAAEGQSPADRLLEGLTVGQAVEPREIIARTRL